MGRNAWKDLRESDEEGFRDEADFQEWAMEVALEEISLCCYFFHIWMQSKTKPKSQTLKTPLQVGRNEAMLYPCSQLANFSKSKCILVDLYLILAKREHLSANLDYLKM